MNSYLILAICLFGYMSLWFVISVIKSRNDVADIAWGLGFVTLAWLAFFLAGFHFTSLIVNILVTIWGIRLASHIYSRNKNKPEDSRYQLWRKTWTHFYLRSYFQVFLLQGILLYLISLPVIFINLSQFTGNSLFVLTGLVIWSIGYYFESTADRQLQNFISNPSNKGRLMESGLWRFSRHPNYFGEITQWWGIFIIGLHISNYIFTIVGPLTISILIIFVSGIPLLEKKYADRSDFIAYKKRTSILFPLPPKT